MKIKQLSAIVSVIIMLFTLTAMFTGCSEKATDYSKYTYDQFKDEKWDEKEISYQFTTFDASVDEKTLSYFPCVMNLYKDGSVAIYEFWPFKELKDETLVTYTDKSRNLSYVYYGFWSSEEKEGVTTITTNYVCSDNTAVSKDALMDDMNGWITTIVQLPVRLSVRAVPFLQFLLRTARRPIPKPSSGSNLQAMEPYIIKTCRRSMMGLRAALERLQDNN